MRMFSSRSSSISCHDTVGLLIESKLSYFLLPLRFVLVPETIQYPRVRALDKVVDTEDVANSIELSL